MDDATLFFWIGIGLVAYLIALVIGCAVSFWKWTRRKKRGDIS